jgi:hypothetical protein
MSFELPYSNSQNFVKKYGVSGDSKQQRIAVIANKNVERDWIKLSQMINI